MEEISVTFAILAFVLVLTVWKGVKIVPQQQAWIVERLGRYTETLEPGMQLIIPYIDRVAYKHTLKEMALDVPEQSGITRDNVTLLLDGVIYARIVNAKDASYGVTDPIFAVTQLAQTTMRSEIGKLSMDQTFEEREMLNANIVNAINEAAGTWGIQCMRYEIRNINPPATVIKAMELQVAAERQKRAEILESEGKMQAQINLANAEKQEKVLESEGAMTEQINLAKGEAEAIREVATATAEGILLVAKAIIENGGSEAVALKVAEKYVEAFKQLAKEGTTVLLPANVGDAGGMVAQALSVFDAIRSERGTAKAQGPWGQ